MDLLRPRPMHSCSLVQASTQMPTSLVVAAYERRCVRSTLERERRAASHQCAAREPPGPEPRRGTMEHAQESTLADRRPQSGRQERAGDGRSKRPPSRAEGKIFVERVYGGREVLLHLLGARVAQPESLSRHAGAHLDRSRSHVHRAQGGARSTRPRPMAPAQRPTKILRLRTPGR